MGSGVTLAGAMTRGDVDLSRALDGGVDLVLTRSRGCIEDVGAELIGLPSRRL